MIIAELFVETVGLLNFLLLEQYPLRSSCDKAVQNDFTDFFCFWSTGLALAMIMALVITTSKSIQKRYL